MSSVTKLLIFAKVPRLGKVKTRLEPLLGADGCLLLHKCLIAHAMELASGWSLGPVELWLADQLQDSDIQLDIPNDVSIRFQEGESLGQRMQFALRSALFNGDMASGNMAVLIGTDSPQQLSHLKQAARLLKEGADVVVQPAFDGGFVLIGASSHAPEMGGEIDWGTGKVLDQLQAELNMQGLSCKRIETISDLDIEEDIVLLQKDKSHFLSGFYSKLNAQNKA